MILPRERHERKYPSSVRPKWCYRSVSWVYYLGIAVGIVVLLNVVLVVFLAITTRESD